MFITPKMHLTAKQAGIRVSKSRKLSGRDLCMSNGPAVGPTEAAHVTTVPYFVIIHINKALSDFHGY